MMKKIKRSFSLLALLAIVSCSMPVSNPNSFTETQSPTFTNHYLIRGNADFPKKSNIISSLSGNQEFRVHENSTNFSTKANLEQIGNKAVISIITTPEDTIPNQTLATGLTDENGNFTINVGFTPVNNKVYILEAIKRVGGAGNDSMSVRSYIKYNGSLWESITTPSININYKTTAITIIDRYDNNITGDDTIGKIVSGTLNDIGSVNASTINNVAAIVTGILNDNRDPIRFIGYQNNKYYVLKESSLNRDYLLLTKNCPNCNLSHELLNNENLSSGDLSFANLKNSNLSGTNLVNTNLTNANLAKAIFSGSTITGADFTGATWINGGICQSGSIGNCILSDNLINTYTTNQQSFPSMAVDSEGNFVVSWQSNGQDGDNFGIYAQRYSNDGLAQGSEFKVNTYTTGAQSNPSVAMNNDGDFVISWQSNGQDGNSLGIYAQRYTSTGAVNGAEFKVSTYTTGAQSNPAVAMDNDGDFVITWQSNGQDGDNLGIYAQRYNQTGSVNGAEFKVNSHTTNIQNNPAVAMDSDGDFVVVWRSYLQDGSESSIYAQRYNQTGSMVGSEFKVNTYSTNAQRFPSVAMNSDGDFVISWHSSGQDGDNWGVYAQRYNNDGLAQGSEFQVNTYTTNQQLLPTVAMDIDGDFVISWHSNSQDGDNWGVYAQRYNNDGLAQGSEFKVNTYTTNQQLLPTIAMDIDGDFVISWHSTGQDGDTDGIYSQRYDKSGLTK